ncbi:DUF4265 domain-containing protein [Epilithonimonas arachidiradicis]|uniref:Uncharacterized protein DUF4265 n=1 Tax=Epilithonimonas arachidiradicis TaxID=1617282 RepID=A0A420DBW5_9FLAO|nr:DUF4265 domain-containing protein [Epilithonimonas arachidiradicis]RKE88737.1 uncharacterized protein DUF4265 [Epilithonimonas arachidiradicis]GGG55441.1 hypothetical protein GCM10007332_16380 [Epilithonimonas arachidiradicis]
MSDNSEKILVRYYSDVLEEITFETLWAEIIDIQKGFYKIDNIPFYGPGFSFGDIVFAEYDEDEEYITYRNVVEYSGNSTVQIIVLDENIDVMQLRSEFENLGCESEGMGNKYFVMEIPHHINYSEIFKQLSKLSSEDKIGFAEPNISQKHSSEK